jgi:hypothetical protein
MKVALRRKKNEQETQIGSTRWSVGDCHFRGSNVVAVAAQWRASPVGDEAIS